MISCRMIKSALKEFYPEIYEDIISGFRKVDRPFSDIELLSKIFQIKDYDTKSYYLGAVCLMYWENRKRDHYLKFGTCKAVADCLNKKESNTSDDLKASWTVMKYRPEFKTTCQLMVTILDNYKARCNE